MGIGFDWRLKHWSEWLFAAALIALAVKIYMIDFALHQQLVRNGGFWFAVKHLFGW